MTPNIRHFWRAELARWQFASGLLSGWLTLAMVACAMIFGWVMFVYALANPIRYFGSTTVRMTMAGLSVSFAFLSAIVAMIIVAREGRQHALLRLAPNVRPFIAALNRRLAFFALLCVVPAVALRALSAVKAPDSLDAMISLADVTARGFLSEAFVLVYAATLIVITFGWLRAPTRFASLPVYWGAVQWSGQRWLWLLFAACVLIVVGHRIWLRTDMAGAVRVTDTERRQQLNFFERLNSWRLRRAARAIGDGSSSDRITALLATQRSALFTLVTVLATALYITFAPGVFELLVGEWFFAYLVVALLATPTPIPLGQVMLLPLGAERQQVGRILMSVWVRDVRFRLVLGVTGGLALRALVWWLDLYGFMRLPFTESGDELMLLMWKPLMIGVGLYGAAYALCWTMSASPRLLARPGVLAALPMFVVMGFLALGAAIGWVLGQAVPVLNSRDMSALRFAIVNGAVLPVLAWWVNRQLRPEWLHANLGAISTAMQAWAARRQKSHSMH